MILQNRKRLTKEAVDNAIRCLKDSLDQGNENSISLYKLKLKNLQNMRKLVINAEAPQKTNRKREEGSFAT